MQFPSRRVRGILALTIAWMIASNPPIALARQDDGDPRVMADGAYKGFLGVKGPVSIPTTMPLTGEVVMMWDGSGKGRFVFEVEQGRISGDWYEYSHDATITGRFTEGDELVMSGPQHAELTEKGTVSGQATSPVVGPGNFFFNGQVEIVTALNVTGVIAETLQLPSTEFREIREFSFQVEDFKASCTTFNGNWIARIEEAIETVGLTQQLAGTLIGTRIDESELGEEGAQRDFEEEIDSKIGGENGLIDRGLEILNNLSVGETGISSDPSIVEWFYDATRLMHSIRKDVSCGLINGDESKYLSPISNLAAQMFQAIGANPEFNPVEGMPIYIGAIGSGLMSGNGFVGDPAELPSFQETANQNLQAGFNSMVERGGPVKFMNNEAKRYLDAAQTTGAKEAEENVKDWINNQAGDN